MYVLYYFRFKINNVTKIIKFWFKEKYFLKLKKNAFNNGKINHSFLVKKFSFSFLSKNWFIVKYPDVKKSSRLLFNKVNVHSLYGKQIYKFAKAKNDALKTNFRNMITKIENNKKKTVAFGKSN